MWPMNGPFSFGTRVRCPFLDYRMRDVERCEATLIRVHSLYHSHDRDQGSSDTSTRVEEDEKGYLGMLY